MFYIGFLITLDFKLDCLIYQATACFVLLKRGIFHMACPARMPAPSHITQPLMAVLADPSWKPAVLCPNSSFPYDLLIMHSRISVEGLLLQKMLMTGKHILQHLMEVSAHLLWFKFSHL